VAQSTPGADVSHQERLAGGEMLATRARRHATFDDAKRQRRSGVESAICRVAPPPPSVATRRDRRRQARSPVTPNEVKLLLAVPLAN